MLALLLAPPVAALLSAAGAGRRGTHRFAALPPALRTRTATAITYNDFVNEIRAFKGALRRALTAENGMLSLGDDVNQISTADVIRHKCARLIGAGKRVDQEPGGGRYACLSVSGCDGESEKI